MEQQICERRSEELASSDWHPDTALQPLPGQARPCKAYRDLALRELPITCRQERVYHVSCYLPNFSRIYILRHSRYTVL